jgi:hypothetical protein
METDLLTPLIRLRETAELILILVPAAGVGLLVLREIFGGRP